MFFLSPDDDPRQDQLVGDIRGYVRDLVGKESSVLEIGPSYMPLFPKRDGFNVSIVDHADQADLVRKYQVLNVDPSLIEPVDYVWRGGAISTLLKRRKFDYVYASHVVEHMTDLVRFISDCENILSDDGNVVLVIPDKRYCFDIFQPITDTAKVLGDYVRTSKSHSFESLYREESQASVDYEGKNVLAWWQGRVAGLKLMRADPRGRLRTSLAAVSNPEYVDAHEYFFTPSSFFLIMEELFFHELINLRTKLLTRSRGCEFLAILGPSNGSERLPAERFCTLKRELLLNVIREQTEAWRQLAPIDTPISVGSLFAP
ncbi:methyltransferase domain-containing protein [Mesorhizobium sp. LCM 4577]|uniref:class I SAM-dependent methyltransferase n=1 Tax=Mesorhizobium sp. LCM 4577 TaxID=1848288 RepID=UPI0012FFC7D7